MKSITVILSLAFLGLAIQARAEEESSLTTVVSPTVSYGEGWNDGNGGDQNKSLRFYERRLEIGGLVWTGNEETAGPYFYCQLSAGAVKTDWKSPDRYRANWGSSIHILSHPILPVRIEANKALTGNCKGIVRADLDVSLTILPPPYEEDYRSHIRFRVGFGRVSFYEGQGVSTKGHQRAASIEVFYEVFPNETGQGGFCLPPRSIEVGYHGSSGKNFGQKEEPSPGGAFVRAHYVVADMVNLSLDASREWLKLESGEKDTRTLVGININVLLMP